MKCSSEKLSSLSLDVQRREDESSDLREKLADAKKQIQQVQREVSHLQSHVKNGQNEAFRCLDHDVYCLMCVCVFRSAPCVM